MAKRGNKTGQFYLVAAIIIAGIAIGLVAVANYSKKQEQTEINSLKEEIQIESSMVLDHALNTGESQQETSNLMQDFTQIYIDSESRDKNLYFIFGRQSNIILKGYQKNAHNVLLNGNQITSSSGEFSGSTNSGSSVVLQIDEDQHTFELGGGENFYFIISQEASGGDYVVVG